MKSRLNNEKLGHFLECKLQHKWNVVEFVWISCIYLMYLDKDILRDVKDWQPKLFFKLNVLK